MGAPRILSRPSLVVEVEVSVMSSRTVVVRYRVKADRVEENVSAVREVFTELERSSPGGIRYATYRTGDGDGTGVGFMHLAWIETDDGKNPLLAVEAFQRFAATVRDRCVEPPVTTELEVVGAYRLGP